MTFSFREIPHAKLLKQKIVTSFYEKEKKKFYLASVVGILSVVSPSNNTSEVFV